MRSKRPGQDIRRFVWLSVLAILVLQLTLPATAATPQQALDFDGTNDYVALGNPPALDITGAVTLTAWIRLATDGHTQRIVNK